MKISWRYHGNSMDVRMDVRMDILWIYTHPVNGLEKIIHEKPNIGKVENNGLP